MQLVVRVKLRLTPRSTSSVAVVIGVFYVCANSFPTHGFSLLGFVITYTFVLVSFTGSCTRLHAGGYSAKWGSRCPGTPMSNDLALRNAQSTAVYRQAILIWPCVSL